MKRESVAAQATADETTWRMPEILRESYAPSIPQPAPRFVMVIWTLLTIPITAISLAVGWQSRWTWPGYLILWGALTLVIGFLVVLVVSGLWPFTIFTWLNHKRQQNWIDEAARIERLKVRASVLAEQEHTKRAQVQSWLRNQDSEMVENTITADVRRNERLLTQIPDPGKIELVRFLAECYRRTSDGSYANLLPDGRLRIACPLSTSRNAKYQWRGETRQQARHWLRVLEIATGTWVLKSEDHGWFLNAQELPSLSPLLKLIDGDANGPEWNREL